LTARQNRHRAKWSPPVRVAVVGLGYWGPNILRNLHELDGAEVLWTCDLRKEALRGIARRFPTLRCTTRVEDVLEDPAVEAVVVATPVATHYALAAAALRASKHVFVEKPLAGSSTESLDLIAQAGELGLVLMPGHTFLYSPPVNVIHDLITSGALGDIYFVSTSRVNLGIHQPDVSVFWDLAPHDFSILRYWLDEMPTHVTALGRDCVWPGRPDVAFVNLEFPSRTIAHVELSWLAPSKLRRTAIVGSRKMVVYDDTSTEPVRVFDAGVKIANPANFGEYRLTYRTGNIVSIHVEATEPLLLELADFCTAIRTDSPPRSDAALGLDVVRMIEAAEASLELWGARVEVTSPLTPVA
jgi:predicted dehydrogenase